MKVYEKCKKWYNNKCRVSTLSNEGCRSSKRSKFDWKRDCFFCGKVCTFKIESLYNSVSDKKTILIKPHHCLHAWTGCDTTSAIHTKGKNSILKKLETSQHLRSLMDVLGDKNCDQVQVSEAAIELVLFMYGANCSTQPSGSSTSNCVTLNEVHPEQLNWGWKKEGGHNMSQSRQTLMLHLQN